MFRYIACFEVSMLSRFKVKLYKTVFIIIKGHMPANKNATFK